MKMRVIEIVNGFLLVSLTSVDVMLIVKFGLTNDGWLLIALALLFFIIYLGGRLFPRFTVTLIHKLSKRMYRNSDNISVPTLEEAKETFNSRLPYLLVIVNILMLLLILTFL